MNTVFSTLFTLFPLLLGFAAWVLAGLFCFSGKRTLPLSWICCACALWCPLQMLHRWVQQEAVASILDCTRAYFLCASVLLGINLLLSLIGFLRQRK